MANKPKVLLFSLTRKDFDWDYFAAGGKGGQNQNSVNSGVRCSHSPSGAVGEARDSRDQLQNRRSAFRRCVESPEFKAWHTQEVARRLGQRAQSDEGILAIRKGVSDNVDRMMSPENLKVEYYDANSRS